MFWRLELSGVAEICTSEVSSRRNWLKLSCGAPARVVLRVSLIVEGFVVVELKAVDRFHPIFSAQVITQLKLTDLN